MGSGASCLTKIIAEAKAQLLAAEDTWVLSEKSTSTAAPSESGDWCEWLEQTNESEGKTLGCAGYLPGFSWEQPRRPGW